MTQRRLRYQLLGQSGVRVSNPCLGAMTFGEDVAEDECHRILESYGEMGGNTIDLAHFYAGGASEQMVGSLIKSTRDHWVLSTKFGLSDRRGDPNAGGATRKVIARQLEESLRRLGTDYLDVYWLHTWDALTPIEEVVRALDDLVRVGKIHCYGISNTPAWVTAVAATYATSRDRSRLVAIQAPYNLTQRDVEREHLPMARTLGLTAMTWEPLAAGLLAGGYGAAGPPRTGTRVTTPAYRRDRFTARNLAIADRVEHVAAQRGVAAAPVALAWVLTQQDRAQVVPIVGARTAEQLRTTLSAVDIELTAEELALFDHASHTAPGYPHDFPGQDMPYGETRDRIDTDRLPRAASRSM